MGYQSAQDIDKLIDWDRFSRWGRHAKGSTILTNAGHIVYHEFNDPCDHGTCYETHEISMVFALGDRYFLKAGTYSSQDGMVWGKPLREVKPVTKTVEAFEDVPVYVWDAEGISAFLRKWFGEQPYSAFDWTSLWYAAQKEPLEIPGFPWPIKGTEQYQPGEEDCNGPVWLIFEINDVRYAAKGRNISHVGWDFDSVYMLEVVEKKTVTREVWE